ncbi:putative prolyl 4-hydroxylase 7 [Prunus yedoensis var. nudiflora]|uniref:procollagen-proline 4-dioxygenase n=1 Tax=Prunus yedoensis var. nudiflora TaxID=2094558 RepID=A0A314Y0A9_PRUYE|nr:putative prolyl 4-hydroxylase 7 [Prunus yedoensis var. nudiflora]
MDSRFLLTLSLCLLCIFPHLSYSRSRVPILIEEKKTEGSVLRLRRGASSATFDPTRVINSHGVPGLFFIRVFFLRRNAKDKLEKSMVADNESGKSIESEVRTSSGMFLQKAQDEVVANIEARIAAWTFLPIENGESIQILHYEHGQKYEPHFDYFHDKANQELGGHRGGETVFPNTEAQMSQSKDEDASDCAKQGYSVKPYKGDALMFFSLHPDATTDPSSLHGSCPVIEGEKWSATKWIHVRSFEKSIKHAVSGDCADENDNCPLWAKAGECEKNPTYMGFEGSSWVL